jgi:protein-histidine pros-kinase
MVSFLVGFSVASYIAHIILFDNARQEVVHSAEVMMAAAKAMRDYTITEIKPLHRDHEKRVFVKQTVPAYAANWQFAKMRRNYPDYVYKEATINPTNIKNRPADWERDVINEFKRHPEKKQIIGRRPVAIGENSTEKQLLYLSRPIMVPTERCLSCHGKKSDAPESMKALYASGTGFNWKVGEIVGAQIVTVPMKVPNQRAQKAYITFLILIGCIFLLVAILLNVFLETMIITKVQNISQLANDISLGKQKVPELDTEGSDEISVLAQAFNRMRVSLVSAMDMLQSNSKK